MKTVRLKNIFISTIVTCCSIAAVAQDAERPQNDPLNAVVRIETVSTVPNYLLPWQNRTPQAFIPS